VGRGLGGVGDVRGANGAGMGIMAGASFPDQQGLAGPNSHHGVPCHDDIHWGQGQWHDIMNGGRV
jgi:hypothetical protein